MIALFAASWNESAKVGDGMVCARIVEDAPRTRGPLDHRALLLAERERSLVLGQIFVGRQPSVAAGAIVKGLDRCVDMRSCPRLIPPSARKEK